jgi:hypothetical protein
MKYSYIQLILTKHPVIFDFMPAIITIKSNAEFTCLICQLGKAPILLPEATMPQCSSSGQQSTPVLQQVQ